MGVRVFLSTVLRRYVEGYDGENGISLEPQSLETVRDICVRLGIPSEKIKLAMVNGRRVSLDHPIRDGDRVGLFPPVGGG
ncbi:MAG TPA: TGS domain-containing protein [Desulfobacteraceae bacterium]|jgi:molybdopterin converting factor small subunit|nr:TGS domain-containing protein [Desulfobacteraceae bacterium]